MRSFRSQHNLCAVSAYAQETAINTAQTLDLALLIDESDLANLDQRREANTDELTGYEEPDTIYDLGDLSGMPLTFKRAQAQHFAFLLAFGLGSVSSAAAGSGYQHTITPLSGDVDADRSLPSFTLGYRYSEVFKRRFESMFIDQFTARFDKDSWVQGSAQAKGTGKVTANVVEEEITAKDNVTSLPLAANGVQGATAAVRLQNVHQIRVELDTGEWTEVDYSAVSAATPAVITISAPGSSVVDVTYKVLYVPTESAWATFPSRVTETPLRVAQLTATLGGTWDGSAFVGGRPLTSELRSIEYTLNNNLEIEFVPGAGDAYAGRCFRPGRSQTIKLDREFRDYVLHNLMDNNETLGLYLLAEGDVYDSPHKYQVELIFPKVGVLKSPISVDGKRLAEAGDLIVLEDDTYGSVIAKIKNLATTYAA